MSCWCGRALPHVHQVRDHAYERAAVDDAVMTANRLLGGMSGPGWAQRCHSRLLLGDDLHGVKFMHRDNCKEAMEETPDVMTYPLLDLQKFIALGMDPARIATARLDVIAAGAHASVSDWHVQRCRETLYEI